MKLIAKTLSAIALSISAFAASAAPTYLTTHNLTSEESNAYVAGVHSPYPTPAYQTRQVYWNMVRLACYAHSTPDGKCTATIKMATNTSNPITVGDLTLDLSSGDITPKYLSGNGYTFTVNGPGEATITKN
jgi:hypothetical protein